MPTYKTHTKRNTMKHFTKLLLAMVVTMGLATGLVADATPKATHNVTILTADNSDGKITPETIAAAFEKANDHRDDPELPPLQLPREAVRRLHDVGLARLRRSPAHAHSRADSRIP